VVTIEIGGGPFVFSAAHASLHDGQFEPLHGHTFTVTLYASGDLNEAGMVADFHVVKEAMATVIAPLRRRTLMPAQPPDGSCVTEDGQVFIECGVKRYSLPAGDVALLPLVNTTTEAIAGYLLDELRPCLWDLPGVQLVELHLAEAPDTAVTVSADLAAVRTRSIDEGTMR
jgi:6-pyruvoyl-tetrahydropterin synthase